MIARLARQLALRYTLALSLLCILFFAVGLSSVAEDSVVIDEVAHIAAGYSTLRDWRMNLNLEHPPLTKIVAAVPLLFQDITYRQLAFRTPEQWNEGENLLFEQRNNTDVILFTARAAVLLLHAALLFAVGMVLRHFLEPAWALGAVFLMGFEPNILAHARYVTTDTGIALWSILTLLLATRFIQEPTRRHGTLLGLSMAGTLLTKFSGALLAVMMVVVLAAVAVVKARKREAVKAFLLRTGRAVLLTLVLVWGVYTILNLSTQAQHLQNFIGRSLLPEPLKESQKMLAENPLTRVIPAYVAGFTYASNRTRQQGEVSNHQFLDGEFKTDGEGWWYYFFKAYLYKETPALLFLGLLGLGSAAWLARKRRLELPVALLLLFAGLYMFMAARSSLNIGIRHIAPVLAILPLASFWLLSRWGHRAKYWIAGGVVAGHLASVILAYPFYLAYFNLPSGGPMNGYHLLGDSNVDWGQNLKRLTRWAEDQKLERLYVDYWAKTPLRHYDQKGILTEWHANQGEPDGFLAVLPMWITHSTWAKATGRSAVDYSFLQNKPVYAHIGYGILIYDLRK